MTKRLTRRDEPPKTLRAYLTGPPPVSQRALADALGVHQSMISMLASGKRRPSAMLTAKLHAITGVPLAALLNLEEAEPPPRPRRRRTRRRVPPEEATSGRLSSHF
jgi:transcriptional regulator with XRE-family HTH domain